MNATELMEWLAGACAPLEDGTPVSLQVWAVENGSMLALVARGGEGWKHCPVSATHLLNLPAEARAKVLADCREALARAMK